jgi:hypothetical protein
LTAQAPELRGGLTGQGKGVGDLPKWHDVDEGWSSDGQRCSRAMAPSLMRTSTSAIHPHPHIIRFLVRSLVPMHTN